MQTVGTTGVRLGKGDLDDEEIIPEREGDGTIHVLAGFTGDEIGIHELL